MRQYFPLVVSIIAISLVGLIVLLLTIANRPLWSYRWVKKITWMLPLAGIVTVLFWGLGWFYEMIWFGLASALGTVIIMVLQIALVLSLFVSAIVFWFHKAATIIIRWRTQKQLEPDPDRRSILKLATFSLPAVTMSIGLVGVSQAFSDVKVYKKEIKIDHLPSALEGLRILHISDSHLSQYVSIDTIVTVLEQAEPFAPELIVLTGDIADELSILGETLKLTSELNPRFGTYASLGNHEYYRGLTEVRQIFDRSPVPLLINQSVSIDVDGIALRVAGIDDPRHVGGGGRAFFKNAIDNMLSESESAEFTILLSHRPEALNYASEVNLDLILAGHTHGGQIGATERSLIELISPESYLWGHYQKAQSHLYTSSGVGHWFPFRLGCPAEAPIIEISSK